MDIRAERPERHHQGRTAPGCCKPRRDSPGTGSFLAEVITDLRDVRIAHGAEGHTMAINRILHQADTAIRSRDGGAVDTELAIGERHDFLPPVPEDVGDVLDAPLDSARDRLQRTVLPFADRARQAAEISEPTAPAWPRGCRARRRALSGWRVPGRPGGARA